MYPFVVGIDISKLSLDAVLLINGKKETAIHYHLPNQFEDLKTLFTSFEKVAGFSLDNCLICIESTGVYSYPILTFVAQTNAHVWIESGVQIKKSMGIQRGKNDQVDALRIAIYAAKNQDNVRLWKPANPTLVKIKHLSSLRDRLLKSKQMLLVPIEELNQVGDTQTAKLLAKAMKDSLQALEEDIKALDTQIKTFLDKDSDLKALFTLVTSVVGVGTQTALALMIYTDGFTLFDDARKLVCYAGVAPFEYRSGSSIRGRTRVSKMANAHLKTLLHMASLTAVKLDLQLRAYYQRKLDEGKKKMAVLNAVKAKLLHRVMSVVHRNQKYENSLNFSLILS